MAKKKKRENPSLCGATGAHRSELHLLQAQHATQGGDGGACIQTHTHTHGPPTHTHTRAVRHERLCNLIKRTIKSEATEIGNDGCMNVCVCVSGICMLLGTFFYFEVRKSECILNFRM